MKKELAIFVSLTTFLSFLCKELIASSDGEDISQSQHEVYSAFDSASWAITSNLLSPILGANKQSLYDNYIKACDKATSQDPGYCSRSDKYRTTMNRDQPSSVNNYTKDGYAKIKVPTDLYDLIKDFFDKNRHHAEVEWKEYNVYHNAWVSPPTMVHMARESAGGSISLTSEIEDKVTPILEEWTGQSLSPVSTYGIRIYHNASILAPHVDRMPLVISAIIQVDQDVDEPWPLEVYGHDGIATNVTMEPGDMVLYESHSVIHGRPFPMIGNFFANCFIHFEPYQPIEGESSYDPKSDIPPYLVPGSLWEQEWKNVNPNGWKGREMAASVNDLRSVVSQGNTHRFKSITRLNPQFVHDADRNGWTVLHEAVRGGRLEMVKLILEQGADKDLLTIYGTSPLNIAKLLLRKDHEVIGYLESIGAKDITRQQEL